MRTLFGSSASAFVVLALWPSIASAEESGGFCPERIETEQSLRAPVEGFAGDKQDLPNWWDAITFYDGRPEEMASLVYDSDVQAADGSEVQTWTLDPKREYWIRCQYSSTSVSLVKKLPPVGQCVVTFSGSDRALKVACR